jgi:hypothetical protein
MPSLEHIADLVAQADYLSLRRLKLSRFQIRRFLVPIARAELGEIAPERVKGLKSNWGGKTLMSRYAA